MTYDDWKTNPGEPDEDPNICEDCTHREGDCDCPCCNEPTEEKP